MARAIPKMFRTVTPHLTIEGASNAIKFYKKAFGAKELSRMKTPDGKHLMHAMIKIGNSVVMLNDAFPEWGSKGPSLGRIGGRRPSLCRGCRQGFQEGAQGRCHRRHADRGHVLG